MWHHYCGTPFHFYGLYSLSCSIFVVNPKRALVFSLYFLTCSTFAVNPNRILGFHCDAFYVFCVFQFRSLVALGPHAHQNYPQYRKRKKRNSMIHKLIHRHNCPTQNHQIRTILLVLPDSLEKRGCPPWILAL